MDDWDYNMTSSVVFFTWNSFEQTPLKHALLDLFRDSPFIFFDSIPGYRPKATISNFWHRFFTTLLNLGLNSLQCYNERWPDLHVSLWMFSLNLGKDHYLIERSIYRIAIMSGHFRRSSYISGHWFVKLMQHLPVRSMDPFRFLIARTWSRSMEMKYGACISKLYT